jgi:hypothetical protein
MFTMDLSPRGNKDVDAYVRSFEPNQVQLVVPHRVMAFTLKGRKLIIRRWPAAGTMRVGASNGGSGRTIALRMSDCQLLPCEAAGPLQKH